jgi:hypothetical protein
MRFWQNEAPWKEPVETQERVYSSMRVPYRVVWALRRMMFER